MHAPVHTHTHMHAYMCVYTDFTYTAYVDAIRLQITIPIHLSDDG